MIRCAICGHVSGEHYPMGGRCRHAEQASTCPCPGFRVPVPA